MSLQKYLGQLKVRHNELEDEIRREMTYRMPDFAAISELKKKKLRIKEMLERVARRLGALESKTSTLSG